MAPHSRTTASTSDISLHRTKYASQKQPFSDSLRIEERSDFAAEQFIRKRLGNQFDIRVEPPVMNNGIRCVPCRNPQRRRNFIKSGTMQVRPLSRAASHRPPQMLDPIFTVPRLHRSTACSGAIEAIVCQMLRSEGNGKLAK